MVEPILGAAGVARQLFGFEAKTDFADGLRRTVDWYLANRQQAERPPHRA